MWYQTAYKTCWNLYCTAFYCCPSLHWCIACLELYFVSYVYHKASICSWTILTWTIPEWFGDIVGIWFDVYNFLSQKPFDLQQAIGIVIAMAGWVISRCCFLFNFLEYFLIWYACCCDLYYFCLLGWLSVIAYTEIRRRGQNVAAAAAALSSSNSSSTTDMRASSSSSGSRSTVHKS